MPTGVRGNHVYHVKSNKAPFVSNAVLDSNLLATGASKTIAIVDHAGNANMSTGITINNLSGMDATVTLTTLRNMDPTHPVTESANPIYVPTGTSVTIDDVSVVSLVEKNIGTGTQTGHGVQYIATLYANA